jgi:integrase
MEAARWLSLVESVLSRQTWIDPSRGRLPLRAYAEAWVAERPELRHKTLELYRSLLRRHVLPFLGDVPLLKITTERVRSWCSDLLANGVSPTTTAKAYRLLRAILATAVDDEPIVRDPCRIKGASSEPTPERPVATVRQVFTIADQMPARLRALVLQATFASLRWDELVALRRKNLDLVRGLVRVVAAYNELSTAEMRPPKSTAGRRSVALPKPILPSLVTHMDEHAQPGADGLVFVGPKGSPLRRGNVDKMVRWRDVVANAGIPGLRFPGLRHTGNTLVAPSPTRSTRRWSVTCRPPMTVVARSGPNPAGT